MRLIASFLLITSALWAQRAIYNGNLAKQGQDAAAAAALISSDSATAQEVANLAVIEQEQLDAALASSSNTMRLAIQSFDRWSNLFEALTDVSDAIELLKAASLPAAELTRRQREIKGSAEEFKKAVVAKSTSETGDVLVVAAGTLDAAVAHISDVNDLVELAKGIPGLGNLAGSNAANEVEGGLRELDQLFKAATNAIQAAKDVRVKPHALMPTQSELMLSVLAAETDSLKERIAIRVRADLDIGDVRSLVDSTTTLMENLDDCIRPCTPAKLSQSKRLISDSLAEGDVQRKEQLLTVLYQAAAASAQNQTAAAVALIRDSIAWRRFEIRRNSIYNGAYEQALLTASQRLSAYYATGIKPAQIAQFLYYLSATVALPGLAF